MHLSNEQFSLQMMRSAILAYSVVSVCMLWFQKRHCERITPSCLEQMSLSRSMLSFHKSRWCGTFVPQIVRLSLPCFCLPGGSLLTTLVRLKRTNDSKYVWQFNQKNCNKTQIYYSIGEEWTSQLILGLRDKTICIFFTEQELKPDNSRTEDDVLISPAHGCVEWTESQCLIGSVCLRDLSITV